MGTPKRTAIILFAAIWLSTNARGSPCIVSSNKESSSEVEGYSGIHAIAYHAHSTSAVNSALAKTQYGKPIIVSDDGAGATTSEVNEWSGLISNAWQHYEHLDDTLVEAWGGGAQGGKVIDGPEDFTADSKTNLARMGSLASALTPYGTLTRVGSELRWNGQKVRLMGFSWYGAMVGFNCDIDGYLDVLHSYGVNFTRVWVIDMWTVLAEFNNWNNGVVPFTGSFGSYNLYQLNDAFFNRAKAFVEAAAARGIVVQLTLFDRCGLQCGADFRFNHSPYNAANNAYDFLTCSGSYPAFTGMDGTQIGDVNRPLINRCVRELQSYGNVIFEIMNEPGSSFSSVEAWHKWVADIVNSNNESQAPSTPTNVQATALTAAFVQVTWTASTDNVGVVGYKIYRNGSFAHRSSGTSYTDTGLLPSMTYSYTVAAYDAMGNESAQSSPQATATTHADTQAPSMPENVQATDDSPTSVLVTWTASLDNVQVAGYKVYRNGSQVGTPVGASYTDTGLTSSTTYSYTISAYDYGGNNSAQSAPPAVATTEPVLNYCSVDLGASDVNNNLSRAANSDGDTISTTAEGLECRKPVNTGDQYFYVRVDDSFLYNTDVAAYLEVCYYDDQSSSVYLEPQYDSTSSAYTSASKVYLGNTGKWKTATWTLTNCKFANRQNASADFRIYVGAYSVKIDSVRLSKVAFSTHNTVERNLGSSEVYKGLSHPQNSDGDTTVATIGGRSARKCAASGDNYMYFNVSDAIIYNGSPSTVYLKVAYYDSPGGMIQPQYDSTSGVYTNATTLNFPGTNTWKQATWTLTNARFANNQSGSADFRLSVGTGQNVYVDRVTVSKTPFTLDTTTPSVPVGVQAVAKLPTVIRVTWSASTDNVGVTGYKVYRNGAQIAASSSTNCTDAGLSANTTYSYNISAYDAAGNQSAQSSPPATARTMIPMDIGTAKGLPSLSSVGLVSKTVTAIFADGFYVEETDRNVGIRIVPVETPSGLAIGATVDVGGTMQTVSGERRIGEATASIH